MAGINRFCLLVALLAFILCSTSARHLRTRRCQELSCCQVTFNGAKNCFDEVTRQCTTCVLCGDGFLDQAHNMCNSEEAANVTNAQNSTTKQPLTCDCNHGISDTTAGDECKCTCTEGWTTNASRQMAGTPTVFCMDTRVDPISTVIVNGTAIDGGNPTATAVAPWAYAVPIVILVCACCLGRWCCKKKKLKDQPRSSCCCASACCWLCTCTKSVCGMGMFCLHKRSAVYSDHTTDRSPDRKKLERLPPRKHNDMRGNTNENTTTTTETHVHTQQPATSHGNDPIAQAHEKIILPAPQRSVVKRVYASHGSPHTSELSPIEITSSVLQTDPGEHSLAPFPMTSTLKVLLQPATSRGNDHVAQAHEKIILPSPQRSAMKRVYASHGSPHTSELSPVEVTSSVLQTNPDEHSLAPFPMTTSLKVLLHAPPPLPTSPPPQYLQYPPVQFSSHAHPHNELAEAEA